MRSMNLQYFGGRGSAAGKRNTSSGGSKSAAQEFKEAWEKTPLGKEAVKKREGIKTIKASAESVAPSGSYVTTDGDGPYDITYTRERSGRGEAVLQQNVDGHAYGGRVTINDKDFGSKKTYTAVNSLDDYKETNSLKVATSWAFKLPSDWKKNKKK